MYKTNEQRKAMFANLNLRRLANPYAVAAESEMDFDRDGVPLSIDINPLGNLAMGSGMQIVGYPPLHTGDMDSDRVNDMLDVNPLGSYAEDLEKQVEPLLGRTRYEPPNFGDRFAARLMKLYPGNGQDVDVYEKTKRLGTGLGYKVSRLWPDIDGGDLVARSSRIGDRAEERFKRIGDPLAVKVAGLWPG